MSSDWDDDLFNQWQELREQYRQCKKNKDYSNVIHYCEQIIELDKKAKFIEIMVPLFEKDTGDAYLKCGNRHMARKHFILAVNGFKEYRKNNALSSPDDWLKDIERLQKKIDKID